MEVKINATPVDAKEDKKYGKFDEWEINSAVDTLVRAQEIRNDAEKMKYVEPLLQEKFDSVQKAINSLPELRARAKKRIAELDNKG